MEISWGLKLKFISDCFSKFEIFSFEKTEHNVFLSFFLLALNVILRRFSIVFSVSRSNLELRENGVKEINEEYTLGGGLKDEGWISHIFLTP